MTYNQEERIVRAIERTVDLIEDFIKNTSKKNNPDTHRL